MKSALFDTDVCIVTSDSKETTDHLDSTTPDVSSPWSMSFVQHWTVRNDGSTKKKKQISDLLKCE